MTTDTSGNVNFERLLKRMREELLRAQETGAEAEKTVELDQSRVGRLSRMDAMQAQAMSVETGRRRRERLRQIKGALRRIRDGEFGICLDCDEPISAGRLQADPAVRLCIGCARSKDF